MSSGHPTCYQESGERILKKSDQRGRSKARRKWCHQVRAANQTTGRWTMSSLQDGLRDDKCYWEGGARGRTQVFKLGFLNYGKKLTLFYDDLSLDLIWILTWIKVPSLHQRFLANKGHRDQLLSRVASAFRIIPVINKISFA